MEKLFEEAVTMADNYELINVGEKNCKSILILYVMVIKGYEDFRIHSPWLLYGDFIE